MISAKREKKFSEKVILAKPIAKLKPIEVIYFNVSFQFRIC
jgi:hypothetical protein